MIYAVLFWDHTSTVSTMNLFQRCYLPSASEDIRGTQSQKGVLLQTQALAQLTFFWYLEREDKLICEFLYRIH